MNVPASLDALRAGLASGAHGGLARGRLARGGASRRAAVLILPFATGPLSASGPDGLSIVLIEKTAHLRSHAGQLAFPGGTIEESDASPVAAALREADEEVGIAPASVDVLGELPTAHVRVSGFDVAPVVVWWRQPAPLAPRDTDEVAAAHVVSMADLVAPENRATWVYASGFDGPAFVIGDLFVWGFTAALLDGLVRLAGWEQPWDASRRLDVPERFLRGRRDDGS